MGKRECGTCTKCCEGYLAGEALGHTFFQGKPCHFIAIGKGCSVYAKRPKDPCQSYRCEWLTNVNIPEWMKPSDIDAIIDMRKIEEIEYLNIKEAGSPMQARVLSWMFQYALKNNLNIKWETDGGVNWVGSLDFIALMDLKSNLGK